MSSKKQDEHPKICFWQPFAADYGVKWVNHMVLFRYLERLSAKKKDMKYGEGLLFEKNVPNAYLLALRTHTLSIFNF